MTPNKVGGSHLQLVLNNLLGTTNVLRVWAEPSGLSPLDSPITQHHPRKAKRKQPIKLFKISQGQHVTQQGEVQKVQPLFFFLTTWFVSTPFPFKTHPSQLAALSIIYFGCLLENKRSCSCRWVCQTCVYFPVSGSLLFLLKPDPLKWIPGHQEKTKKNLQKKKGIFFCGNKKKLSKNKTFTLISPKCASLKIPKHLLLKAIIKAWGHFASLKLFCFL